PRPDAAGGVRRLLVQSRERRGVFGPRGPRARAARDRPSDQERSAPAAAGGSGGASRLVGAGPQRSRLGAPLLRSRHAPRARVEVPPRPSAWRALLTPCCSPRRACATICLHSAWERCPPPCPIRLETLKD